MSALGKTALCLTGGGVTGGLYQIGALAALEDSIGGLSFDIHIGTSSGATVAASLAGGVSVQRLYRALLDPSDHFFPLGRGHILTLDSAEWRRTLLAAVSALRYGLASLTARSAAPAPGDLWEQLDRFYDALPAGIFTLDRYERFLSDFFLRRGVPNSFRALPKELLIPANDLDAGERVLFGTPGFDHVPISVACTASMALPLFFSPVRIGGRFYVDGEVGQISFIDDAAERDARLVVIVNPNVPVRPEPSASEVPTGHGTARSLRDKGLMWVGIQTHRTVVHARLHDAIERGKNRFVLTPLLIEPDSRDAVRFLHNAASLAARRDILEWAYRTARDKARQWASENKDAIAAFGWSPRSTVRPVTIPPRAVD